MTDREPGAEGGREGRRDELRVGGLTGGEQVWRERWIEDRDGEGANNTDHGRWYD